MKRRIQDPVKHLRFNVVKMVNIFYSLTIFTKCCILLNLISSECASVLSKFLVDFDDLKVLISRYWEKNQCLYLYKIRVLIMLNLRFTKMKVKLKLTSYVILHYLWSADLSKSSPQLIVSIFTFLNQQFSQYLSFLNIFFNRFQKCGVTPYCLYSDSLILNS